MPEAFLEGSGRIIGQEIGTEKKPLFPRLLPDHYGEVPDVARIRLLGGFEASIGSRTVEEKDWRLKKAASLVKLLALAPGHRMHRDRVMDHLWPRSGMKASSNNLRQVLHRARRILDPGSGSRDRYLSVEHEQIVLCPRGRLWVDVEAFEEAAAAARSSRDLATYRAALDLYAGDLLPEDLYEVWAEGRREELRQLHLALLLEAAELYEERKEYGPATKALSKAVAKEPTLEEAHAALMRNYALSERRREALAQYGRLEEVLSERLGTQPSPTVRLLRDEIAAGKVAPTLSGDRSQREKPPDAGKHNLPGVRTSFVGREREMEEVVRVIFMTRLLTLTGTGGCGKTRLALEVSRKLVGAYPDGVWFVQLAPLSDGALVTQAIAATLDVREQPGRPLLDTLLAALREKDTLLVLDNCEHLVDAAARLADTLLASCPRLRVFATSREPLGVAGEVIRLVPPLSAPGAQQFLTVEKVANYEAARLFADRASERNPGFELTPESAPAVARICARLEGIPLAVELAAARVGVLSAEQISDRLGHALKLLTGGDRTVDRRHQTLRATLDWSHELLSEPEQALFGRLSVFVGGFTLEAAEGVGAGRGIEEEDVLELLSMLVDRSLVVAEESWERGARYRLLEPVRQYAREKLEVSEEAEETRRRHARWYLALAEEADQESRGPSHARWLQRLETEHDNLRAALGWSLEEGDAELGLRLAGALWVFWFTQGYSFEGWGWLERGTSLGGSKAARAKALNGAGWIALFHGDPETAKGFLEESVTLYRELRDEEGLASSLNYLGYVALLGGREDVPVAALLQEALALKPRVHNRHTIADTLVFAALDALLLRREWEETVALHEEALTLYREMDSRWGLGYCLTNLGLISEAMGRHARAKELLRELMHRSRKLGDMFGTQYSFFGLACVADSEGQTARAARLWGVSEAIREAAGFRLPHAALSVMEYESRLAGARARMSDAAFEEAWEEGKTMTPEEAVEYALSEGEPAPSAVLSLKETPADERSPALTHREQEVALLVALGQSNRQIASELSISERTAANHVSSILHKLGLVSRVQIAALVTEHKALAHSDPN